MRRGWEFAQVVILEQGVATGEGPCDANHRDIDGRERCAEFWERVYQTSGYVFH